MFAVKFVEAVCRKVIGILCVAERLRLEDESLARALHMKRKIIGEIFNVPESDYRELLEVVCAYFWLCYLAAD